LVASGRGPQAQVAQRPCSARLLPDRQSPAIRLPMSRMHVRWPQHPNRRPMPNPSVDQSITALVRLHPPDRDHRGGGRSRANPSCPCWRLWNSTEARPGRRPKQAVAPVAPVAPVASAPAGRNSSARCLAARTWQHRSSGWSARSTRTWPRQDQEVREQRRVAKGAQAAGANAATPKKKMR